eukprot:TRINITY_DN21709_c0_g1_i1.p1 TRINITY_DN21709_c0_g1~~TRINITY_DN21709_c0_g1_i1.p1  ORF type:complete len:2879 (+),score=740.97 TRINITY_DN21709_c0_g1_i1:95-8638(+)
MQRLALPAAVAALQASAAAPAGPPVRCSGQGDCGERESCTVDNITEGQLTGVCRRVWQDAFSLDVACTKGKNRLYGGKTFDQDRSIYGTDGLRRCRTYCESVYPESDIYEYWARDLDCSELGNIPSPSRQCPLGWCNCYATCQATRCVERGVCHEHGGNVSTFFRIQPYAPTVESLNEILTKRCGLSIRASQPDFTTQGLTPLGAEKLRCCGREIDQQKRQVDLCWNSTDYLVATHVNAMRLLRSSTPSVTEPWEVSLARAISEALSNATSSTPCPQGCTWTRAQGDHFCRPCMGIECGSPSCSTSQTSGADETCGKCSTHQVCVDKGCQLQGKDSVLLLLAPFGRRSGGEAVDNATANQVNISAWIAWKKFQNSTNPWARQLTSQLHFEYYDSDCQEDVMIRNLGKVVAMTKQRGAPLIVGAVGPWCTATSTVSAALLGEQSIPQISYGAEGDQLSNKQQFPYFTRTSPRTTDIARALVAVCRHFQWKYVGLIAANDPVSNAFVDIFREEAGRGMSDYPMVASHGQYRLLSDPADNEPGGAGDNGTGSNNTNSPGGTGGIRQHWDLEIDDALKEICQARLRVVVLYAFNVGDAMRVLELAEKRGMVGPGWTWITSRWSIGLGSADKGALEHTRRLGGALYVQAGQSAQDSPLATEVEAQLRRTKPKCGSGEGGLECQMDTTAPFAHDATYAILQALADLYASGTPLGHGADLLVALRRVNFSGATGQVYFDHATGDRLGGQYSLMNVHPQTGQPVPVGDIAEVPGNLTATYSGGAINWMGNRTSPPPARFVPNFVIGMLSRAVTEGKECYLTYRVMAELAARHVSSRNSEYCNKIGGLSKLDKKWIDKMGVDSHDYTVSLAFADARRAPDIGDAYADRMRALGFTEGSDSVPVAVVGPPSSDEAKAAAQAFRRSPYDILSVALSATAPSLSQERNFHRLISDDQRSAEVLAQIIQDVVYQRPHLVRGKAITGLFTNAVYAQGYQKALKEALRKKRFAQELDEKVYTERGDPVALLGTIKDLGPHLVVTVAGDPDLEVIAEQANRLEMTFNNGWLFLSGDAIVSGNIKAETQYWAGVRPSLTSGSAAWDKLMKHWDTEVTGADVARHVPQGVNLSAAPQNCAWAPSVYDSVVYIATLVDLLWAAWTTQDTGADPGINSSRVTKEAASSSNPEDWSGCLAVQNKYLVMRVEGGDSAAYKEIALYNGNDFDFADGCDRFTCIIPEAPPSSATDWVPIVVPIVVAVVLVICLAFGIRWWLQRRRCVHLDSEGGLRLQFSVAQDGLSMFTVGGVGPSMPAITSIQYTFGAAGGQTGGNLLVTSNKGLCPKSETIPIAQGQHRRLLRLRVLAQLHFVPCELPDFSKSWADRSIFTRLMNMRELRRKAAAESAAPAALVVLAVAVDPWRADRQAQWRRLMGAALAATAGVLGCLAQLSLRQRLGEVFDSIVDELEHLTVLPSAADQRRRNSLASSHAPRKCVKCGNQLLQDSRHCRMCGLTVSASTDDPDLAARELPSRQSDGLESVGSTLTQRHVSDFRFVSMQGGLEINMTDQRAPMDLLNWMSTFVRDWCAAFPNDEDQFHAVDVRCTDSEGPHNPRNPSMEMRQANPICCTVRGTITAIDRCKRLVFSSSRGQSITRLEELPAHRLRDGFLACFVYSQELMHPVWRKPRSLQIYHKMNEAMRMVGEQGRTADKRYFTVLHLFRPVVWHLSGMLEDMWRPGDCGTVYRGIGKPVARQYRSGTVFTWHSFSSSSRDSATAFFFLSRSDHSGEGSLFIMSSCHAADIAYASLLPDEEEAVFPPMTEFVVMAKLPETLLTMLDTTNDVVVVAERAYDMAPSMQMDAILQTVTYSSFVYDDFAARYIEPNVKVNGGDQAVPLHEHFRGLVSRAVTSPVSASCQHAKAARRRALSVQVPPALAPPKRRASGTAPATGAAAGEQSVKRVCLVVGSPGTGKTTLSLALNRELVAQLQKKPEATFAHGQLGEHPVVPIFMHLPWAAGLDLQRTTAATPRTSTVRANDADGLNGALLRLLHINPRNRELVSELRRRRLVIFLDSLDECAETAPGLRDMEGLLAHGGFELAEWPNTLVVITCRLEWLQSNGLGLAEIAGEGIPAERLDVMPFDSDMEKRYVQCSVTHETLLLAKRLAGAQEDEEGLDKAVQEMRTVRPSDACLRRLQRDVFRRLYEKHRSTQSSQSGDLYFTAQQKNTAAEAAAKGSAGQACTNDSIAGVTKQLDVLRRSEPGKLQNAFLLFMAVSAAPELQRRRAELVRTSPRWETYDAYLVLNTRRRSRQTVVRYVEDSAQREQFVFEIMMRIAVGMCQEAVWQSTAGRCLALMDLPQLATPLKRDLLACMAMRVDSVETDSARASFRHRTIAEFLIARDVAFTPGSRALTCCDLTRLPVVQQFMFEHMTRLRNYTPARYAETRSMLQLFARSPDNRLAAVNARHILLQEESGCAGAPLEIAKLGLRRPSLWAEGASPLRRQSFAPPQEGVARFDSSVQVHNMAAQRAGGDSYSGLMPRAATDAARADSELAQSTVRQAPLAVSAQDGQPGPPLFDLASHSDGGALPPEDGPQTPPRSPAAVLRLRSLHMGRELSGNSDEGDSVRDPDGGGTACSPEPAARGAAPADATPPATAPQHPLPFPAAVPALAAAGATPAAPAPARAPPRVGTGPPLSTLDLLPAPVRRSPLQPAACGAGTPQRAQAPGSAPTPPLQQQQEHHPGANGLAPRPSARPRPEALAVPRSGTPSLDGGGRLTVAQLLPGSPQARMAPGPPDAAPGRGPPRALSVPLPALPVSAPPSGTRTPSAAGISPPKRKQHSQQPAAPAVLSLIPGASPLVTRVPPPPAPAL